MKTVYDEGGGNETFHYVSEDYMVVYNSSGTFPVKYVRDGSGTLMARINPDGSKNYYHPDHLGSTRIITNEGGDVIAEYEYLPYGGELAGGNNSVYTFTGQEHDPEINLMYYKARYHSPYLRQFTQPDSIIPEIYNPQALNRYAYTLNNPVIYIDPSGRKYELVKFIVTFTEFQVIVIGVFAESFGRYVGVEILTSQDIAQSWVANLGEMPDRESCDKRNQEYRDKANNLVYQQIGLTDLIPNPFLEIGPSICRICPEEESHKGNGDGSNGENEPEPTDNHDDDDGGGSHFTYDINGFDITTQRDSSEESENTKKPAFFHLGKSRPKKEE